MENCGRSFIFHFPFSIFNFATATAHAANDTTAPTKASLVMKSVMLHANYTISTPRRCGKQFSRTNRVTRQQDRSSLVEVKRKPNVAAKLFVSREDERLCPAAGQNPQGEAETWRRARRSLKPDGKATVQIAQRAIRPPTGSWRAPVGAKLAHTSTIKRSSLATHFTS